MMVLEAMPSNNYAEMMFLSWCKQQRNLNNCEVFFMKINEILQKLSHVISFRIGRNERVTFCVKTHKESLMVLNMQSNADMQWATRARKLCQDQGYISQQVLLEFFFIFVSERIFGCFDHLHGPCLDPSSIQNVCSPKKESHMYGVLNEVYL